MLLSYLKSALGDAKRHFGVTLINVLGLAIGLAACALISLYVRDEWTHDAFHANADRIYRVLRQFDLPDLHATIETTPNALAPALAGVPGVERAIRVNGTQSPIVKRNGPEFVETGFLLADDGFFDVFSFPLVRGAVALDRPGTLVLSEAAAAKYFGAENPVGQTLRVNDRDVTVTGVFANVPRASHLRFDFVASYPPPARVDWGRNNDSTYLLLAPDASVDAVARDVATIVEANERQAGEFIPHLQPLRGIHFGLGVPVEIEAEGNVVYVYLFGALAVFIALLACVNFVNLATARSAERAREVGVRKALGADRRRLIVQFGGESVAITAIAALLAAALCALVLPAFNSLTGKSLGLATFAGGRELLVVGAIVAAIGVGAGAYPAFVLSGFSPERVLRAGSVRIGGAEGLRRALVVFQFVVSIALVAGTAVVLKQFRYMTSAGLGFAPENVLVIQQARFLGNGLAVLENELARLPRVENVASGFSMPSTFFVNTMWQASEPNAAAHNLDYSFVGDGWVDTLGIEVAAGRALAPAAFAADESGVMLNEAAARDFGWSAQEAVGRKIKLFGSREDLTVVGVLKDFHFRSLRDEIYPLALLGPDAPLRYVAVRVSPDDLAGTVRNVEAVWKRLSDLPFEYSFLADDLVAQYAAERQLAEVVAVFGALAIVIACLGLVGLAAFAAERRRKEIGVRKVLGARTARLVAMLTGDFLKLVAVAFVLAVPLAWLAAEAWLARFAYRTEVGVWPFAIAGAVAAIVAIGTSGYQALRAASTRPVKVLRYE
ncbi:MAG TPA: ABC transporter permease [Gammaproteobacteria bacterium]|nr:ABC transporter permease [Gammaproteobacteria bacterium]